MIRGCGAGRLDSMGKPGRTRLRNQKVLPGHLSMVMLRAARCQFRTKTVKGAWLGAMTMKFDAIGGGTGLTRWQSSIVVLALCLASPALWADEVNYTRRIQPILADNCFTFHGRDEAERQSHLRLDLAAGAIRELDSGVTTVVPGNLNDSELIRHILLDDPDEVMPPVDAKDQLTPQTKELLVEWIKQGADYQKHWAYEGPNRPDPPDVDDSTWQNNSINRFILSAMRPQRLKPTVTH